MNKYSKSYIGKGTAVAGMDIVKVTLKVEDLMKVTHEFNGVEYLTFELAKMQSKDDYGRTHTAYVSVREQAAEEPAADKKAGKAAEKAAKKAAKKASKEEPVLETADSEIPF
jgi:phage protein D